MNSPKAKKYRIATKTDISDIEQTLPTKAPIEVDREEEVSIIKPKFIISTHMNQAPTARETIDPRQGLMESLTSMIIKMQDHAEPSTHFGVRDNRGNWVDEGNWVRESVRTSQKAVVVGESWVEINVRHVGGLNDQPAWGGGTFDVADVVTSIGGQDGVIEILTQTHNYKRGDEDERADERAGVVYRMYHSPWVGVNGRAVIRDEDRVTLYESDVAGPVWSDKISTEALEKIIEKVGQFAEAPRLRKRDHLHRILIGGEQKATADAVNGILA